MLKVWLIGGFRRQDQALSRQYCWSCLWELLPFTNNISFRYDCLSRAIL